MRRHALQILLIVFGLIPVALWIALAANIEPAGLGRSIGLAILVLLAPLPFGGVLMIAGAAWLTRTRRLGRILATIGAAIMLIGVAILAIVWVRRFADCGGPPGACTGTLIEGLGGFAYALAHAGLIALVWRGAGAPQSSNARSSAAIP